MRKDFQALKSTFKNSIQTWDYFVNWEKVFANKSQLEIVLNKLNYLLGKEDLRDEFERLFRTNPDIVSAFPILLAVRLKKSKSLQLIEVFDKDSKSSEFFDFKKYEADTQKYFSFLEKSGLVRLFQKEGVKNLVDYVMGVEVGLDSNGRKNRGGTLMEDIVESFVLDFCKKHDLEYRAQVSPTKINKIWGIQLTVNKSEREFDFAIFNPRTRNLKIVETNFYNGGGSKLKAVCGEFKNLFDELSAQNVDFIWITDGLGWNTALRPLEEVYEHNDYVFNLSMVESGALDQITW
jgi:hypothetical protein